jgi:hypothetical protein
MRCSYSKETLALYVENDLPTVAEASKWSRMSHRARPAGSTVNS